jgi:hypothetical protein
MVTTLDYGQRAARKAYRCGLCNAVIHPGDHHAFQTNVYDGRIYTWRDCLACQRDGVITYVNDWDGGWSDEGVDYEKADQWAERTAARNWLARAAGDE